MRAIVDGKRYDTETAERVAYNHYSYPSDFRHCHEDLYRTKGGRWFVAGAGGPLSRYAVSTGQNSWSGGSAIRPLTDEEARKLLEEWGEPEAIERHFSVEDA